MPPVKTTTRRPAAWSPVAILLLALTLSACEVAHSVTGPAMPPSWNVEARQFVTLINQHRATLGCQPLHWHERAAAVARDHSADMVARGFFDHVTPDGVELADRLRRAGIYYGLAGENIAAGQTDADWVFQAWLRSPDHRMIIENCRYSHHGLGRERNHWTLVLLAG